MSRRNSSRESASSPKLEEKFAFLLLMFDIQKRQLQMKSPFETYISRQTFTSSAETEENLALGMPMINTASNITHFAITSEDSSQVTTTFSAHCTAHCSARDFNVKFCESRWKVSKILYPTVRMISRERALCAGTAINRVTSGPQWVQCKDYVHVEIYQTGICEVEVCYDLSQCGAKAYSKK